VAIHDNSDASWGDAEAAVDRPDIAINTTGMAS
jgi:hypothetical protein